MYVSVNGNADENGGIVSRGIVVVTDALQREIRRRLREGEKASRMMMEKGLTRRQVENIARRRPRIFLKKGPQNICGDPVLYRARYDEKHKPGAAEELLSQRGGMTFGQIAQGLGKEERHRGSAYYLLKRFTGTAQVKRCLRPKKASVPTKPEITVDMVRESAQRCATITEMVLDLRVSNALIHRRAAMGGFTLPRHREVRT